uniref:Ig-like domain-containing protein n=1 Tax=Globodera rostochiensis TaxID=31243 RepID=A0A914HVA4_GLORO
MKSPTRRTFFESFSSRVLNHFVVLLLVTSAQLPLIATFSSTDRPRHNEMLVPINSTSALICEPVFNQQGHFQNAGQGEKAKWIKDGREVARVNSHSNAILGSERVMPSTDDQPRRGLEPIPKIGFLVITNTLPQDEGEYWCERVRDGQRGESTRLRVAYLKPFDPGERPKLVRGDQNLLVEGQLVALECPKPDGVPSPVINWLFNGERVDFATQNMQMVPNGSLLVHNVSANQSGLFACEAANFAGRSISSELFLAPPKISRQFPETAVQKRSTSFLVECLSAYVRSGVLWFLIGCLTTSCVVLAYILGALLLYRFNSLQQNRHRWHRILLSVAPGFRKTVAPVAERMAPPPYFDSARTNEV